MSLRYLCISGSQGYIQNIMFSTFKEAILFDDKIIWLLCMHLSIKKQNFEIYLQNQAVKRNQTYWFYVYSLKVVFIIFDKLINTCPF